MKNNKGLQFLQTTKEVANIHHIAEIRVFQAIQSYGVPRHFLNGKVAVDKGEFYEFINREPELFNQWKERYISVHR